MDKKYNMLNRQEKRYTTLIVRLAINQTGHCQSGVIIDLNEHPIGRIRQLSELPPIIERWLEKEQRRQGVENEITTQYM